LGDRTGLAAEHDLGAKLILDSRPQETRSPFATRNPPKTTLPDVNHIGWNESLFQRGGRSFDPSHPAGGEARKTPSRSTAVELDKERPIQLRPHLRDRLAQVVGHEGEPVRTTTYCDAVSLPTLRPIHIPFDSDAWSPTVRFADQLERLQTGEVQQQD
jgi:hypothetical protein